MTISAWYLPWLQWSFPDDDEKESIYVRSTVKIAFLYYCLWFISYESDKDRGKGR